MHQDRKPYYQNEPIGSMDSLALKLGYRKDYLIMIAESAETRYRLADEIVKTDGSTRKVYNAKQELKDIQENINKRIFRKVIFPLYLQGGIKDNENPRDYISNARIHSGSTLVINEDIRNFFPSIDRSKVFLMWKHLFNFPDEVATCLTKLTTYNDCIPQGGKCSSFIANLIFWDTEYILYEELNKRGFKYSRFIDDVTISTKLAPHAVDTYELIRDLYRMFFSKGLAPNRKKHNISYSSQCKSVHRLNINNDNRPTMTKKKRNQIRAAVFECESYFKNGLSDIIMYRSTLGRVRSMMRLHKVEGEKLLIRLKLVGPNNI